MATLADVIDFTSTDIDKLDAQHAHLVIVEESARMQNTSNMPYSKVASINARIAEVKKFRHRLEDRIAELVAESAK